MITYAKSEQKKPYDDTVQKKKSETVASSSNLTGIPNSMKTRFENLSGFSFNDIRVHYNSDKPAQLQALAYTQGTQVYIAPEQEKHLEHELGHVIQQKRESIKPTVTVNGIGVNDDAKLEYAADRIKYMALTAPTDFKKGFYSENTIQMCKEPTEKAKKPVTLTIKSVPIKNQIEQLLKKNASKSNNVYINPNTGYTPLTLALLYKYFSGGLKLYRGSLQWYFNFPQDPEYKHIMPKGPKVPSTDPPPDFASNDNNWIPFSPFLSESMAVVDGNTTTTAEYIRSGAVDLRKPYAIVQEITIRPPDHIAFGMDGEVQIKGFHKAENVLLLMWSQPYPRIVDEERRMPIDFPGTIGYGAREVIAQTDPAFNYKFTQTEYDKIHLSGYQRPKGL